MGVQSNQLIWLGILCDVRSSLKPPAIDTTIGAFSVEVAGNVRLSDTS